MYTPGMSRFLTITEARRQLLDLPEVVESEPVVITRHGKPAMVALSYAQYEALQETLEVLEDAELRGALRESLAQAERGERLSLAEARERLLREE